jgi:hypothetical protein
LRKRTPNIWLVMALAGLALLVIATAGCGAKPTPTPTPTRTPKPTFTPTITKTPTPLWTPTPVWTPTPLPPTATPVPPTATPRPPTATPVPRPPTDTPLPPTPTTPPKPRYEFNIALVQSCDRQPAGNWFKGTVYKNGQPVNGYRVVFSYEPDGQWATPPQISGPHPGYTDWPQGYYSHIINAPGTGPKAGNWFVWIVNEQGVRISEIANFQTTGPGNGCNEAVVDFDSR